MWEEKRIKDLEVALTEIMELDVSCRKCRECFYLSECVEAREDDYTHCLRNIARQALNNLEE